MLTGIVCIYKENEEQRITLTKKKESGYRSALLFMERNRISWRTAVSSRRKDSDGNEYKQNVNNILTIKACFAIFGVFLYSKS